MWLNSSAFRSTLLESSRKWATKIEVLFGNEIVTSLNTMVTGYIGIDNVAVRREAHFTIVDADGVLTPSRATDLLSPKGTELRIYRGLYVPNSHGVYAPEWVPMGVFGIVTPKVRANEAGTQIDIKGFDRMDKLRNLHFEDPFVVAKGTFIHEAIANIISQQMPGQQMRITPSPFITPEVVYDRLSSPWDAIRDLAGSSDFLCYFDQLGTAVVEPYVENQTGVHYTTGVRSVMLTSTAEWDSSVTYSGVIARGMHPDKKPVRYEIWDEDPKSPTYSLGPFGRRPYGFYSQLAITDDQIQAVAEGLFRRIVQFKQIVEIEVRGTPGHEIGDVIKVTDPRTRITGNYVIISGTIPIITEQGSHTRLRCTQANLIRS